MRVLLISPNIEYLPDPVFPIGLACIAGALKDNGTPYQVLDLCFQDDYEAAIVSAVTDFRPRVIGISLRNIDNVSYPKYTSYIPLYRRLLEIIREHCDAVVVLGGSGFTLLPGPIIAHLGADYGIIGEGEGLFIRLLNDIATATSPPRPAGGRIIDGRTEIGKNIDALPTPDRSGFDRAAYLRRGGMGNIQTKRGCPFHCIYCTYPVIEGRRVRTRDPKRVCDEIEHIAAQGTKTVFVVDNEFNYPPDHAMAVCREIIRRNINIQWSCYGNPAFVPEALIAAMRGAGCTGIEFGCDAAEPDMLKSMGKNFTVADIIRASAVCRNVGMPFCHSLLLGGPGETMASVRTTCQTILDCRPTAVVCMIGIRIFPETELSRIAVDEKLVNADENYLHPVFYLSASIEKEILPFVEDFSKLNRTWIFPGLQININETIQKKLRRVGIKGPLWEQMKRVRR